MNAIFWFILAAVGELFGCYAFWLWLRKGAAAWWPVLGVASLILFAIALTRVDTPFAARSYAAYGGIYIGASLLWLAVIERAEPTLRDLVGVSVSIAGALIILSGRH